MFGAMDTENTSVHSSPVQRTREKWGSAIDRGYTGFQLLPDVLVRGQHALGLSAGDLVVLLNLLMNWWSKDNKPYTRPTTIARRMGVSKRTVERHLQRLEALDLIARLPPESNGDGPAIRKFDLDGLVRAAEALAAKMRQYEADYELGAPTTTE